MSPDQLTHARNYTITRPPELKRKSTVFKQAAAAFENLFLNAISHDFGTDWDSSLFLSTTCFTRRYIGANAYLFDIHDGVDLVVPGSTANQPSQQQRK